MGKVGGVIVALIIAAVVYGMRSSDTSELRDDTRVKVTALLQTLPDYSEAGPWYEGLATTHHETVFDAHHNMGSRRTGPSFDQMGYIHELLDKMAVDADSANQKERAGYIRELRESVYLDPDSEG